MNATIKEVGVEVTVSPPHSHSQVKDSIFKVIGGYIVTIVVNLLLLAARGLDVIHSKMMKLVKRSFSLFVNHHIKMMAILLLIIN